MRMKKIGLLAMALVLALSLTGAGFAYFSDVETSTGNIAQAGTLDMQISKDNANWKDGSPVNAAWTSPDGWAPGEEFTTDLIYLKNVGSIDAEYIFMRFDNLSCEDGDHPDAEPKDGNHELAKKIVVVSITEYSTGTGSWCTTDVDTAWASHWSIDMPVTLYKFVYKANPEGTSKKTGMYLYNSGADPYLPVGGIAKVKMTFKLLEDTNNSYQGDKCTFDVHFIATNAEPDEVDDYITEHPEW